MLNRRKILLALSILMVAGSLGSTLAYAFHLRSRELRDRIAADLSTRMKLLVEIGRIVPLSFSSRRLQDVQLWLPERQTQIGQCAAATWRRGESSDARRTLDIRDGWLLVGEGGWAPQVYQRLLHSGFAHDFAAMRLAEINVHNIDVRWRHPAFSLTAPAADGVVFFDEGGRGRAALTLAKLNDTPVEEPIHLAAWFTPGAGLRFQKVELRLGRIPIGALALDALAGGPISQGTFAGQIAYREGAPPGWTLAVGGAVHGARLEDFTRRVIGGPFSGEVDVTIDNAEFVYQSGDLPRLEGLQFHGRLRDLSLGEFAAMFREPQLNGRVDLIVEQAEYQRPGLKYARLSGRAVEVSLEALTRLLGYGVVTGRLELRINALSIVDDQVQWADVDLLAIPPDDGAAYLEKSALATLGREVFGLDLGSLLPERVEYVRMGVKLLLDREGLRIRGTHGEGNRTILTVKILGRELPIIRQPDRIYPVNDLVSLVRDRLQTYEVDDFVGWWTRQHGTDAPAATQPASKRP